MFFLHLWELDASRRYCFLFVKIKAYSKFGANRFVNAIAATVATATIAIDLILMSFSPIKV